MRLPGSSKPKDFRRTGKAAAASKPPEILRAWFPSGSGRVFLKDQRESALRYGVAFVDPVLEPAALTKSALQHPIWVRVFRIDMLLLVHRQQDDRVGTNLTGFLLDQRLHSFCHLCRTGVGNDLGKRFVRLFWRCTQHCQITIVRTRFRIDRGEQLDVCHRGIQAVPAATDHPATAKHQPKNDNLHGVYAPPRAVGPYLSCQLAAYNNLLGFLPQPYNPCIVFTLGVVIFALSSVKSVTAEGVVCLVVSGYFVFSIVSVSWKDVEHGINIAKLFYGRREKGVAMINRGRAGMRCRATRLIRTVKGDFPKGAWGTVCYEMENLGRQLVLVAWDKGTTVPVFPDEIEIISFEEARV